MKTKVAIALCALLLLLIPSQGNAKGKTIKLGERLIYRGEVKQKRPMGDGVIAYRNSAKREFPLISGKFCGNKIENGTVSINTFGDDIKCLGDFEYCVNETDMGLVLTFKEGTIEYGELVYTVEPNSDCLVLIVASAERPSQKADNQIIWSQAFPTENADFDAQYIQGAFSAFRAKLTMKEKQTRVIDGNSTGLNSFTLPLFKSKAIVDNGVTYKYDHPGEYNGRIPLRKDNGQKSYFRYELKDGLFGDIQKIGAYIVNDDGSIYDIKDQSEIKPEIILDNTVYNNVREYIGSITESDGAYYKGSFIGEESPDGNFKIERYVTGTFLGRNLKDIWKDGINTSEVARRKEEEEMNNLKTVLQQTQFPSMLDQKTYVACNKLEQIAYGGGPALLFRITMIGFKNDVCYYFQDNVITSVDYNTGGPGKSLYYSSGINGISEEYAKYGIVDEKLYVWKGKIPKNTKSFLFQFHIEQDGNLKDISKSETYYFLDTSITSEPHPVFRKMFREHFNKK